MLRALARSFLAVLAVLLPAGCVSQTARERSVVKAAPGTVDVDQLFASQVTPEKRQQIERMILAGGLGHPDAARRVTQVPAQAKQPSMPSPVRQAPYDWASQPCAAVHPQPGQPYVSSAAPPPTMPAPWMGKPSNSCANGSCPPAANCGWGPPQSVPTPAPVHRQAPPALVQKAVCQSPPAAEYAVPAEPVQALPPAAPVPQALDEVRSAAPVQQAIHEVPSSAPMQQAIYPEATPPVASAQGQTRAATDHEPVEPGSSRPCSNGSNPNIEHPTSNIQHRTEDVDEPPPVPRRQQPPAVPPPSAVRPKVKLKGTAGKPGAGLLAILDIEGTGVRFLREGQSVDVQGPQGPITIRVQRISRDAVFVDVGNASEVLR